MGEKQREVDKRSCVFWQLRCPDNANRATLGSDIISTTLCHPHRKSILPLAPDAPTPLSPYFTFPMCHPDHGIRLSCPPHLRELTLLCLVSANNLHNIYIGSPNRMHLGSLWVNKAVFVVGTDVLLQFSLFVPSCCMS